MFQHIRNSFFFTFYVLLFIFHVVMSSDYELWCRFFAFVCIWCTCYIRWRRKKKEKLNLHSHAAVHNSISFQLITTYYDFYGNQFILCRFVFIILCNCSFGRSSKWIFCSSERECEKVFHLNVCPPILTFEIMVWHSKWVFCVCVCVRKYDFRRKLYNTKN